MTTGNADTEAEWHKSTCPYCGLGCGLLVGVRQGKIVRIRGMQGHPVNRGDLCALAASLPGVFAAEGRLQSPRIRRGGEGEERGQDQRYRPAGRDRCRDNRLTGTAPRRRVGPGSTGRRDRGLHEQAP
ncbi:MAG: hypothetical protein GY856_54665 [bacterium]|nr:hypothetical protein [bacterium]